MSSARVHPYVEADTIYDYSIDQFEKVTLMNESDIGGPSNSTAHPHINEILITFCGKDKTNVPNRVENLSTFLSELSKLNNISILRIEHVALWQLKLIIEFLPENIRELRVHLLDFTKLTARAHSQIQAAFLANQKSERAFFLTPSEDDVLLLDCLRKAKLPNWKFFEMPKAGEPSPYVPKVSKEIVSAAAVAFSPEDPTVSANANAFASFHISSGNSHSSSSKNFLIVADSVKPDEKQMTATSLAPSFFSAPMNSIMPAPLNIPRISPPPIPTASASPPPVPASSPSALVQADTKSVSSDSASFHMNDCADEEDDDAAAAALLFSFARSPASAASPAKSAADITPLSRKNHKLWEHRRNEVGSRIVVVKANEHSTFPRLTRSPEIDTNDVDEDLPPLKKSKVQSKGVVTRSRDTLFAASQPNQPITLDKPKRKITKRKL